MNESFEFARELLWFAWLTVAKEQGILAMNKVHNDALMAAGEIIGLVHLNEFLDGMETVLEFVTAPPGEDLKLHSRSIVIWEEYLHDLVKGVEFPAQSAGEIRETLAKRYADRCRANVAEALDDARSKAITQGLLDRLLIKITGLGLSVRATNALRDSGVRFLGDLVIMTEQEILSTNIIGRRTLKEIKKMLKARDLQLGTKFDSDFAGIYTVMHDNLVAMKNV